MVARKSAAKTPAKKTPARRATKRATIKYDADMKGWPPTTYLVQLQPGIKRFSPEDGSEVGDHEYVALTCQDADPKQAYMFPAAEDGGFIDTTMVPMRTLPYGLPHSVLGQLGYTVLN